MMLSTCICENRCKKGHTFLLGISEITFMHVPTSSSAHQPHHSTSNPQLARYDNILYLLLQLQQHLPVWAGYCYFTFQKYNVAFTTVFQRSSFQA